ncbi:hypothetical protein Tco_1360855 [Tanacetum coccineum]
MFFYLTTLGLARFLKETVPQVEPPAEGQSSNAQAVQAVEAWKHSDFLCHNYVLNGLIDPLYNVYCKTTTAKELWDHWKQDKTEMLFNSRGIRKQKEDDKKGQKGSRSTLLLKRIVKQSSRTCTTAKKSTLRIVSLYIESKNSRYPKEYNNGIQECFFIENIFALLSKGSGSSSRLMTKLFQDKRQRNDNDLQDERQDIPMTKSRTKKKQKGQ